MLRVYWGAVVDYRRKLFFSQVVIWERNELLIPLFFARNGLCDVLIKVDEIS